MRWQIALILKRALHIKYTNHVKAFIMVGNLGPRGVTLITRPVYHNLSRTHESDSVLL